MMKQLYCCYGMKVVRLEGKIQLICVIEFESCHTWSRGQTTYESQDLEV